MASCCPQAPWRGLRPPACGQSTSWPVVFGGTARPSARLSVGHGVPVTPLACARTGEWGSRRVGSRGMATAPARRLAADAYIGDAGNGGSASDVRNYPERPLHKGSWSRQMVREARHDSEVGKNINYVAVGTKTTSQRWMSRSDSDPSVARQAPFDHRGDRASSRFR